MEYEELQVDRATVRDVVLTILKSIGSYTQKLRYPARNIHGLTARSRELQAVLEDVYKQLEESGKLKKTIISVNDSSRQRSERIYYRLYIQGIIFEEVMSLVREGIIMLARIDPDPVAWTGRFIFDPNHILVTEYGERVLANYQVLPYFSEEYIRILRQTHEPDDELKGYLAEGLTCLHHNLPRAAILLLRLPCEHMLQKLVDAIELKLPDETRKNGFKGKIRKASTNLERRANAIFDQLEVDAILLGSATHLKDRVLNELKPTFHTIREVAGNAAHRNVPVDRDQVRHFYGAFASTIYPITMKIVQQLQAS